ncbi:MAG: histidine kinase N-terminal domain-containing protein, partial [Actinobacteria bacterium]|nr:histidine kinase N-terminal domain-containing protein [Actinomycetota bacterium]
MARLDDVASERTDLGDADLDHLRSLVRDWTLLADLAFADLVLWLPTWHGGGFVAADQVRPTTGPTTLFDDVVGQFVARGRRPLLDRAIAARGVIADRGIAGPAPVEAIPIIRAGRILGVIERHYSLT